MNRVGRGIFIVLMFGVATLFAWTALAQREGGAVGGLQVAVSFGQDRPEKSTFLVELRNVAKNELTLNLGMMFGNGTEYPTALNLIVTDEQGRVRRLVVGGPPLAGRVFPWVVHLSVGATFDIPINLVNSTFTIPVAGLLEDYPLYPYDKLSPGTYSVQAQFRGTRDTRALFDLPGVSTQYWEGTATSNQLRLGVPGK